MMDHQFTTVCLAALLALLFFRAASGHLPGHAGHNFTDQVEVDDR